MQALGMTSIRGRGVFGFWLVLVTALLLSSTAMADEAATARERALVLERMQKEPRVALVIGNGKYAAGPLKNPPSDARLIKETLEKLHFEVTFLTDASQDDMKRAIEDFGDKLNAFDEKGGVAFFYYAGHGIQVDGHNYLVPVSAHIKSRRDIDVETVDVERVLGKMDDSKSRLNVVVLDACRNNPFISDKRSVNPGLAQPSAARGTVIAYATGPNSVAEDGDGENSTYSKALAEAMEEPGLELNEVFQAVREKVLNVTQKRQTPWESSSKTGQFFFTPGSVGTGRLLGSIGGGEQARVGLGLEVDLGPSIGLSMGGDVSGSASLPIGFEGVLHGNYTFGSGLAIGLQAGYLLLSRTYSDRDLTLTARGKTPSTSKVEEKQRLGGFLVGLETLYSTRGAWPFTGRIGAGVLLGSLRDERNGTGFKDATGAPYSLDTNQTPSASYLFVSPEVRIGHRFSDQFELSAGLNLYVLAALSRPAWDGTKTVPAGADGIATTDPQKLTGGVVIDLLPNIGARYQF